MTESIDEAITIFTDSSRPEHEREKALQLLKGHSPDKVIPVLVSALHDPDSGVRWAVSEVLARMGDVALKPLLLELASSRNDTNLRQGALHIFQTNHSENIKLRTAGLQKALKVKGPIAQIKSMEAANQLLIQLN